MRRFTLILVAGLCACSPSAPSTPDASTAAPDGSLFAPDAAVAVLDAAMAGSDAAMAAADASASPDSGPPAADWVLAVEPSAPTGKLNGRATTSPMFARPSTWRPPSAPGPTSRWT
jgi:hypothetical protein